MMLPFVELIISKYKEYLLVSNYYVQVPHASSDARSTAQPSRHTGRGRANLA